MNDSDSPRLGGGGAFKPLDILVEGKDDFLEKLHHLDNHLNLQRITEQGTTCRLIRTAKPARLRKRTCLNSSCSVVQIGQEAETVWYLIKPQLSVLIVSMKYEEGFRGYYLKFAKVPVHDIKFRLWNAKWTYHAGNSTYMYRVEESYAPLLQPGETGEAGEAGEAVEASEKPEKPCALFTNPHPLCWQPGRDGCIQVGSFTYRLNINLGQLMMAALAKHNIHINPNWSCPDSMLQKLYPKGEEERKKKGYHYCGGFMDAYYQVDVVIKNASASASDKSGKSGKSNTHILDEQTLITAHEEWQAICKLRHKLEQPQPQLYNSQNMRTLLEELCDHEAQSAMHHS
jgi:hypothetical protein